MAALSEAAKGVGVMARRSSFSATFNGVRYLLFALGVLLLIGSSVKTDGQTSTDIPAFAWFCVVVGFPVPLLVLPFRFVAWLLRLFGIGKRKKQRSPKTFGKIPEASTCDSELSVARTPASKQSTSNNSLVVSRFVKGARYLLKSGCVVECLGFRGSKNRRAAFMDYGELEYWPKKRTEHSDYFLWNVIRLENGVEVCDRGKIRADYLASEQQAAEWAAMVKEREDGQRAYWAERKEKRERDAKRLAELEKLAKEKGWE